MRKEYDFSKARRNPYARRLKKPITLRLDEDTIDYFMRVFWPTPAPRLAALEVGRRMTCSGCER
jgi:hypothetical protein